MYKMAPRLLLLVLLGSTSVAQAQEKPTAREVIDAYLKEIGGKEELQKIKSQRSKGTVTFAGLPQKATFELIQARPNKSLLITELAGLATIKQGFDGKVGWVINPVTGAKLIEGDELTELIVDSDLDGDLHEDKNYQSIENLGEVTFNKKKCWKLKFVRKKGSEVIEYYDVATKLRAGSERSMRTIAGTTRVTTIIEEYKQFGKIKQMSKFRQTLPDSDVVTTIESVEYNKVEDKEFALPAEIKTLVEKKSKD